MRFYWKWIETKRNVVWTNPNAIMENNFSLHIVDLLVLNHLRSKCVKIVFFYNFTSLEATAITGYRTIATVHSIVFFLFFPHHTIHNTPTQIFIVLKSIKILAMASVVFIALHVVPIAVWAFFYWFAFNSMVFNWFNPFCKFRYKVLALLLK